MPGDFLGGHISYVLVERPPMSGWVQHLARTITPEGIVNRLEDRRTSLHRSIERRIRIRHPET